MQLERWTETDSIVLTAVTGTDGLPYSQ